MLWLNDTKLNWLVKDFLTSIIAKLFTKSHLLNFAINVGSAVRPSNQTDRSVSKNRPSPKVGQFSLAMETQPGWQPQKPSPVAFCIWWKKAQSTIKVGSNLGCKQGLSTLCMFNAFPMWNLIPGRWKTWSTNLRL